ncbi:MAG: cytochrome [Caulobacteraceae bacterium]|nr:cytochrome [Caulobacteraceae bacterium]
MAMTLHWLIAALIVTNIGLAWYFNSLNGLPKIPPVQLHKSFGITILLLSLARLAWRIVSPPPPLPASLSRWERMAASTVYVLFYGVMIGMPLSGWALTSASLIIRFEPIKLFGTIPWPAIGPLTHLPAPAMKQTHDTFVTVHGLLADLAYGLIVVHVAAALRHLVLLRDGVMGRMVPFLPAASA